MKLEICTYRPKFNDKNPSYMQLFEALSSCPALTRGFDIEVDENNELIIRTGFVYDVNLHKSLENLY